MVFSSISLEASLSVYVCLTIIIVSDGSEI